MDLLTLVVAGAALAIGAAVAVLTLRTVYAARLASARTETELLRERVVDLEAALAEDSETAALLAPLRDALGRVESQVGTLERDRMEQFGSLRTLLLRVEGETSDLGRATASLAGSLRSSTVRGAWGEVQLRRVLESAGMLARCDFDEQVSGTNRHERGTKPDVVVHLPGGKHLVIDAKAPMTAFLEAQAEDLAEDERSALLRSHAAALRGHVSVLAAKDYWSAFDASPEMVVCFVPTDAMLGSALDADPSLHEWGLGQRVALVGPAALMALLRTVALTWQQDSLSRNAVELMRLARDLHARLSTMGAHVSKMGRSLTSSVEAYNAFVGTLEQRVLVTARRMSELGVLGEDLSVAEPLTSGPRVLTAHELIAAATAEDDRSELAFDLAGAGSAGVGADAPGAGLLSPGDAAEPGRRPA